MNSLLKSAVALLVLAAPFALAGCDTKEKVIDIETPGGEIEVERDKVDGDVDVDVDNNNP